MAIKTWMRLSLLIRDGNTLQNVSSKIFDKMAKQFYQSYSNLKMDLFPIVFPFFGIKMMTVIFLSMCLMIIFEKSITYQ